MQTSENCHPKKFLAVEIVVGEDKCTTAVKLLGKSDQSAVPCGLLHMKTVQPIDLRHARKEDIFSCWDSVF